MKILISCPFGLISVLHKELKLLGYQSFDSFDTGTFVEGDRETLYQINLRSRVANKTYIILKEKTITSFDQLFNLTYKINRKEYVHNFSHITVFAKSKNSKLESEKTIQSITQKAIYKRLLPSHIERQSKTTVPPTDIKVTVFDNHLQIMINATGQGLFKRGYRTEVGEAPIKENLAAGLILLAGRRFKEKFIDPFCGSGTFVIESAMIAKNIAPGLKRDFAFQNFKNYQKSLFDELKKQAKAKIYPSQYEIYGYDKDPDLIQIAKNNASNAGVQDCSNFETQDFLKHALPHDHNTRIITNPPYGKRLNPEEINLLYTKLIQLLEKGDIKGGFISNIPEISTQIKHPEWKKNFIYNGGVPSTFWRIQHNNTKQKQNTPTKPNHKPKISPREASILNKKI